MKYYNIIKEKRERKNYTTRELGERVGVCLAHIFL